MFDDAKFSAGEVFCAFTLKYFRRGIINLHRNFSTFQFYSQNFHKMPTRELCSSEKVCTRKVKNNWNITSVSKLKSSSRYKCKLFCASTPKYFCRGPINFHHNFQLLLARIRVCQRKSLWVRTRKLKIIVCFLLGLKFSPTKVWRVKFFCVLTLKYFRRGLINIRHSSSISYAKKFRKFHKMLTKKFESSAQIWRGVREVEKFESCGKIY